MLNENAKKWVAALRSGEYERTYGKLASSDNSYCCLGVACEIAIKNGVLVEKKRHGDCYIYDTCTGVLPIRVKDWLGLCDATGWHREKGVSIDFVELNDKRKLSFSQIADIIEAEPTNLFHEVISA